MFVWLVWAFIFIDFRFLTVPHFVAARVKGSALIDVAKTPLYFDIDKRFIGCLYSDVCASEEECIDDNVYGRCIEKMSIIITDPDEVISSKDDAFLNGLEKVRRSLWDSGFTWHDLLTQCIVRTALFSYKARTPVDLSICEPYVLGRVVDTNGVTNLPKRSEEPIRVHKYAPRTIEDIFDAMERDYELPAGYDGEENDEKTLPLEEEEDTVVILDPLQSYGTEELQTGDEDLSGMLEENELSDWEAPTNEDLPLSNDYDVNEENTAALNDDSQSENEFLEDFSRMILEQQKAKDAQRDQLEKTENEPQNELPVTQDLGVAETNEKTSQTSRADLKKRIFSRRTYYLDHADTSRVVDKSWVTIRLDRSSPLNNKIAKEFLRNLTEQLDSGTIFNEYKVNATTQEITFRVPNTHATDLVKILGSNSSFVPGYTVVEASIGRESDSIPFDALHPENNRFILTLILCSAVLAAVTIVLVIFFIQRHRLGNKKLWMDYSNEPTVTSIQPIFYGGSGSTQGTDAYRDLCRQHAQSKAMEESLDNLLPEQGGRRRSTDGKHSEESTSPRTSTSSWSEEPAQSNMDISTGHAILSYMEEHLKKKDKVEAEWKTLASYEPDGAQVTEARKNASKNRSMHALPYDRSRVKLNQPGPNSTDYINASFIVDHDPKTPLYIATQGPLVNTVVDFWQMVWEQNSVVIVNLSCLIEAGVPMCQKYWPEEGSQVFEKFEVHLVSEHVWCDEYLVRSFYLKNLHTNETRTITQFHYIAWPDEKVPNSSRSLLEFRRKVNKSFRNKTSPVLIHCSDGCGRSGTYILLDMILTRLSRGVKEVDVAAALEHIRDQRMDMVKTQEQFEFVLLCIAEEVQSVLKVMSS